ncbi:hypothetical protein [Microbispora sp. NBC_01389]|uniref:hypothetical protein n=1 Tax=Microbispora sp. NBC_01389 TaxID=2903584 RepID=UPI00324F2AD3
MVRWIVAFVDRPRDRFAAGAAFVAAFVARGRHWIVTRDPAGGVYCLTGRDPETGSLPG